MTLSSFPNDGDVQLILDASVVINLNATGHASSILASIPNPALVTENVLGELQRGAGNGHADEEKLQALIASGTVAPMPISSQASSTYQQLIEGPASETLDDGEAATIACALQANAVAVVDEKKGRSICETRFPNLGIASTIELIIHPAIALSLGSDVQREAVFSALYHGRMRVPEEHIEAAIALIGNDQAKKCSSLPNKFRQRA